MAIPSSQSIRSESEMVTERAVMPVDLFRAAIEGNSNVLIRRLQLLPKEFQEMKVTIEDSYSAPDEINTENQTVQFELQSATRFGDTILHLLITKGHNELALKVFQRDMSLLKAQNNMLETPLYCAAKVGNENVIHNLIQSDHIIVKGALKERNKNGDTTLHVAAKHDHRDIGRMLMNFDSEVAYKVNGEMKSPLYMAINEGHTFMVHAMLEVDPTLACNPFSDGMFPIHEAARMGNWDLVKHFIEKYPDDAELRDPHGRNLFHIAAEENVKEIFSGVFKDASFREMIERMNTATNYEGNTPFHIAAMKGYTTIMRAIWEHGHVAETVRNRQGLTPFQLSAKEVVRTNEDIDDDDISSYIERKGDKFTQEWFDEVMDPPLKNKWEKTQVIGLGSVLITTVAFAAAFTIPGGYNQDNGTPILGRRYMAMAFILGFLSLFALLWRYKGPIRPTIQFAIITFLCAACSMVLAFGLGMYVTLTPVCYPIAILLLIITLIIGSPTVLYILLIGESLFESHTKKARTILMPSVVCLMLIFCLGLM